MKMAPALLILLPLLILQLILGTSCSKGKNTDLASLSWLPATARALMSCNNPADCTASTLGRRFGIPAWAGKTVVMYQNEYSPALLLPAGFAAPVKVVGVKAHRGRPFDLLPNQLAARHGATKPAAAEPWARYAWPQGQIIGGESAVTDVMDVVTGSKPAFDNEREAYKPLLEKFGLRHTVEYNFSAGSQEEGRTGVGLALILTSLPLQTLLSPVASYKGRVTLLERDGARCTVTYGVQLNGGIASRSLRTLLYSALSLGTVAGWPLGPEYLSKWKTDRDGNVVTARLDLTKAGCDYLGE
jgi:hypothetical protein